MWFVRHNLRKPIMKTTAIKQARTFTRGQLLARKTHNRLPTKVICCQSSHPIKKVVIAARSKSSAAIFWINQGRRIGCIADYKIGGYCAEEFEQGCLITGGKSARHKLHSTACVTSSAYVLSRALIRQFMLGVLWRKRESVLPNHDK